MFPRSISQLKNLFVLGVIVLLAVACGTSSTSDKAPTVVEPSGGGGASGAGLPKTNGAAVMAYLKDLDYQGSWQLWPGKGELYEGAEPHGMLLTTYLDKTAFDALADKAGIMPVGSIVVKENYTPDKVLDATTVMYKVAGYNPEINDWFWAKLGNDGAVLAEGQVAGCQTCHGQKKDNDFIWTGPLK